ncbi:major facilitator superfamily domain-containing protein [Xylariaceae sp. FL0255]|nr:major facilitator superfamily domain-containing protein [Xylariaceae sp. FL0255]
MEPPTKEKDFSERSWSPSLDEKSFGTSWLRLDDNKDDEKMSPWSHRRSRRREISMNDKEKDIEGYIAPTSSKDTSDSPLSKDSDIRYVYLTFDTPVPAPRIPTTPGFDTSSLPASPDLARYVDPQRWPKTRKSMMLIVACIATLCTAYTAGAYSPAAYHIAIEVSTTHELALLGVTTFCLGFAFAPMVLAPVSEIYGRYPVFAAAGVLFVVFQVVCGLVHNLVGMLFARFFLGVASSVFSTMVGGVISDLYDKETRNTPMALFSGAVLFGTGLGPLVSAIIVENTSASGQAWKWVFWHQAIADFVLVIAVDLLFYESRGSVVLSKKAKALNKWYEQLEADGVFGVWMTKNTSEPQDSAREDEEKRTISSGTGTGLQLQRIRWLVLADEERGSLATMMSTSLVRPFHLLLTEPIVFFFSLWVSFAWAVLYLTFGSIPFVYAQVYGFNAQQAGLVFLAMIIGSILATLIGIYQENLLKHPQWAGKVAGLGTDSGDEIELKSDRIWAFLRRRFPVEAPENRLYFTCLSAILLPAGLFLFGFSSQPSIHWIVPAIGITLATMGIYYVYLATFNYLADVYTLYASSALATQSFCRNILGGTFPLATIPLFTNLGDKGAGGLLGGIAIVLTIVPFILVFYGGKIRSRSAFAMALDNHS